MTDALLSFFLEQPLPAQFALREVLAAADHPLNVAATAFIQELDGRQVEAAIEQRWQYSPVAREHQELQARCELAAHSIETEVVRRRHAEIIRDRGAVPKPYSHAALEGVRIGSDHLVDLDAFDLTGRAIQRREYVFQLLPTLWQRNSVYWVFQRLALLRNAADIKVRLDPFMVTPAAEYRGMVYAMTVYGRPLNWAEIAGLKAESHGRWMPEDPDGSQVAFTDVSWTPRGDEVHFVAEEVPKPDFCTIRPARYLHGIFVPSVQKIIHTDGALRLYQQDEIQARLTTRVAHAGKAGQRIKVFRADGDIEPAEWCSLAASFLVWNDDATEYFNGGGGSFDASANTNTKQGH